MSCNKSYRMNWYRTSVTELSGTSFIYYKKGEYKMREKKLKYLLLMVCMFAFCVTSCGKKSGGENQQVSFQEAVTEPAVTSQGSEDVQSAQPDMEEVDYQKYFDNLNGGAVFYDVNANKYYIYNKEICERQDSPCSTFKIISTLMGLHEHVLTDMDTKMGYDGTVYPMDLWNKDLGLNDAFKASCVWYFRKVIDKVGQEKVKHYVDDLQFGNCDISAWNGTGEREPANLNGFWLGSSLKITAVEWVDVLNKIYNGSTEFSSSEVDILTNIMYTDDIGGAKIYGKTGTGGPDADGKVDNGWFVGKCDVQEKTYFFAVHLTEPASKDVSGPKAQMIASSIIQNEFSN